MSHIVLYKTNRSPSLFDTIKVDGAPFDLTGSSAKLQMRLEAAKAADPLKADTVATIVTPAAGIVRYDWSVGDVDTAGDYVAWWRVTLPSAKTQDTAEFRVQILEHGAGVPDLCEIADVRSYLRKPAGDRDQDELIGFLIRCASRAIMRYAGRAFAPLELDAAKTFLYQPNQLGLVDLAPYLLRNVDSPGYVKLHPEEASPQTLVAGEDYELHPVGGWGADGFFTTLRLSRQLSVSSTHLRRFGTARLEVKGDWGTIPDDVAQAAIVTVGIWVRRDVAAFNTAFNLEAGFLERPEALPSAVRGMLADFVRKFH
jgi:hypothetical protein